jgi:hypothetical protein
MPTIHVPGDGHATPVPLGDGTRWDEYSDPKIKKILEQAIFILRHNVRGMRPCEDAFSALPGGRTFTQVLDDASVFVSFDPAGPNSGRTDAVGGKEITIGAREFRVGRWSVAATLVHELAHVNGADAVGADAENTLRSCGFSSHFRPGVVGARDNDGSPVTRMA